MSRRLNILGFSLVQMRQHFGSRDETTLRHLLERVRSEYGHLDAASREQLGEALERIVQSGVPFAELQQESWLHAAAASLLASEQQNLLVTSANVYNATALQGGLWPTYRKLAAPTTQAFFRALTDGLPIFGQACERESAYAAIGIDRLRGFQPGLQDFAQLLSFRMNKDGTGAEQRAAAAFATEFSAWIDEVIVAERDLWFACG